MTPTSIGTPRLLVRCCEAQESQVYGRINDLRGSPGEWYREWGQWANLGALQLFIILPGHTSYDAPNVPQGTVIGFIKIERTRNEVSFRIHPEFRQRGYMKEALEYTFERYFRSSRSEELFVQTSRDNQAVLRLMNGFGLVGQDGTECPGGSVFWIFGWATWRYRNAG
ncbi:hypothetical protein ONS95_004334 [Cadophora gregata]|uniref:uncharacterized protein n=1 Tax=Cadophora gregata TaxID=51156 RepID=UPI0026DC8DB0|nr:uncharacterized protein ONS95_004334 [Cadophora gregata]KAK0105281.1 hypothetical protein ONS96_004677 [Cadophora gregata f. sp. sojae]KAK0105818.1 hypothetical protein ONS95_004334 [Cadophora gregata]